MIKIKMLIPSFAEVSAIMNDSMACKGGVPLRWVRFELSEEL
jgi:hypothetical protein